MGGFCCVARDTKDSPLQPVVHHPDLHEAFKAALAVSASEGSEELRAFAKAQADNISKVLSLFEPDGSLTAGPLPASCFNDLYKWTMLPVIIAAESGFKNDVRCTFSVNVRHEGYRQALYESAIASSKGQEAPLFDELKASLKALLQRKFDRGRFEKVVDELKIPGWEAPVLDAVCGSAAAPRMLIQEFKDDLSVKEPASPSESGGVMVQVFVAMDCKIKKERLFIEATGPWHKVTWLETSMMQAVYNALFRNKKREEYGEEDKHWYAKWMVECMCRCVRSVKAAADTGMKGALFTGRRTGGLPLMMLQGLYVQQAFKGADGTSMMLGTSSVTARYMTIEAGVDPKVVPVVAGTHAHELQMVLSALLGELDEKVGMPLSMVISHLMYFYKSRPRGDVSDPAKKVLMPMLTDTIGSKAFMKTATCVKVPFGANEGQPFLSIIGAARQDSGGLDSFKEIMTEFGFVGGMMASEIETSKDLEEASKIGYKTFGAGGYMGDSEKAWDSSKPNISMACKVVRVYREGTRTPTVYGPTKTGETGDQGKIKEGKFELDGTLSAEDTEKARERAQSQADAALRLGDAAEVQPLVVETLKQFGIENPQARSSWFGF
jgi:nicotinic acid phosphoribosyltransferase